MVRSEQTKDLPKGFIRHLLGHGGLYTDLIEIELNQIRDDIFKHLPPPNQIQHVTLME